MRPSAAVVTLLAVSTLALAACTSSGSPQATVTVTKPNGAVSTATTDPAAASSLSSSASASKPAVATKPVHIRLLNSDGSVYGVGMPVIAYFSKKITDGKALQAATKATVNGKPVQAAGWYFEYSSAQTGYPIEAHFRLADFWPAHSQIHIDIPAKGLSAGPGLTYDDSLTLDFSTGARNISTVDDASHTITVSSDGKQFGRFPVSLGSDKTPTKRGTKVIMEKGRDIRMTGPGYDDPHVKYTQRLTYGGEYLHAAPWNTYNIGHGIDSSNGCTNLYDSVAIKLYNFLRIGDVVMYPNATGPQMQLGDGYGDWNVDPAVWATGGLVPTK
jgi:lipoprotein-anchoring transpeptidase ErfK/SrfK